MEKYILFGAGTYGIEALKYYGRENIIYFMDNSKEKINTYIDGVKVLSFDDGIENKDKNKIVITVSENYIDKFIKQLEDVGIKEYILFLDIKHKIKREEILKRPDYIGFYKNAVDFIFKDIVDKKSTLIDELSDKVYSDILEFYNDSLFNFGYRILKKQCSLKEFDADLLNENSTTKLFSEAISFYKNNDVENGNDRFYKALNFHLKNNIFYGLKIEDKENVKLSDRAYDKYLAMKFFLDALYYKSIADFDISSPLFKSEYPKTDGRYKIIENKIRELNKNMNLNIADVGCGKGAYIKNLIEELPNNNYYGIDISKKVLKFCDIESVITKEGSLTKIPFDNDFFDFLYTCEALEHAIDIESAIREMSRVLKSGATVAIVDKNIEKYGFFDIGAWEQWLCEEKMVSIMEKYFTDIEIIKDIPYDNLSGNGLFIAFTGRKI